MQDGVALPDTLVGTDSHTTMVNGLGVLGWGVGGIEAEAAMLGQPMFLPTPLVVGVRVSRRAPGRDDGDRPGPDAHPDAARARGGRKVRRVLRRRLLDARARGPRDAVEHVPRVRGHVRVLAGRRRDPALPPAHRSGRPGRSRRALHEGAGPVPARRRPRADLHRDRRARPRRDRTLGRRTEAAAGPRPALARVGFVRRGVPRPARARPRRDRGRPAPRGGRERRRSGSTSTRPSSRVPRSRWRSTTAPSVTARS